MRSDRQRVGEGENERRQKEKERRDRQRGKKTDRQRERVPAAIHPRRGLGRPPVQSSEAGCTLTQGNSWLSSWSPPVNPLVSATSTTG